MRSGLRVVVFGILGQIHLAGIAWQMLHYLEGFRRLGCQVHYVEDTGTWAYDPQQNTDSEDCSYTVTYIARLMTSYDFADRWAYCAEPGRRVFGMSPQQLGQVLDQADLLVNLTGSTILRKEHLHIPVRIYLETDPVQAQVKATQGQQEILSNLGAHTHHFTFGENLGAPDCRVPTGCFKYQPTRQPIILDWWNSEDMGHQATCFSTISNWRQSGRDVTWNGETYTWSKHQEFLKFVDLPARTSQAFDLALACDDPEAIALLRSHGWQVRDAIALSQDISPYRDYILQSRGEFTVAKDQNIRLRSGWFSDRSACYLSACRPVITQDTGFGNTLPTGKGLFAFQNMDQILLAIDQINSDYSGHRRAAEEIAREYFSADRVLRYLLNRAGM
jgi:hypothetical protein